MSETDDARTGTPAGDTSGRPDPAHLEDLPATLDAFAAAWVTLSRLLAAAPAQETIDAVRSMAGDWPLGAREAPERRAARLLARSAQDEEDADAVRRDVQRLFTGPGHLLAPPYESVHLNRSGLVFEEETLAVRAVYRRHGLQFERRQREPDDHVALELEFLATLAGRALDALDRGGWEPGTPLPPGAVKALGGIAEFLENHALLWHHRLGELTLEHADTAFVQALGSLLMGTTRQAAATFAAPVDPARLAQEADARERRKVDSSNAAEVWDAMEEDARRRMREARDAKGQPTVSGAGSMAGDDRPVGEQQGDPRP